MSEFYAYVFCDGVDPDAGFKSCGQVGLTVRQYSDQLKNPNVKWRCPQCGASAAFDDASFEKMHYDNDDELWTQERAIELCRTLEPIAADHGCHVALTGGCLYRDGPRKDVDILLYRSLDEPAIDWVKLADAFLARAQVEIYADFGYCKKARYKGMRVDLFDPHEAGDASSECDDLPIPPAKTEQPLESAYE